MTTITNVAICSGWESDTVQRVCVEAVSFEWVRGDSTRSFIFGHSLPRGFSGPPAWLIATVCPDYYAG